jgi:damage-control phosphatase, subfamily I
MQTYLECIPCLLRQAVEAPRMVAASDAVQETIVRKVLKELASGDFSQSPPVMAQAIHRHIRELTGQKDPYKKIKERFNALAISLLPGLEQTVAQAQQPMATAVRLAIAGNVIDMGINGNLEDDQVKEAIEHALVSPLQGELEPFIQAVSKAKRILYLADNAGEIVFDRLLLQQLPLERVTLAVRGAPIINDATREDAVAAGIDTLVNVIDNGSDAPGTVLSDCSESFLHHFNQADLVIAKGQGNYETLNNAPKDIFFILKAKCPVIAKDLGGTVGDLILRRSIHKTETAYPRRVES